MMLKSNYDNRLAVVGGEAKAAANGNIIICKHDAKSKHLQKICVYGF